MPGYGPSWLSSSRCLSCPQAVVGQVATPLEFDASVDGFTPRGTPIATRINTGILVQQAMGDGTLRGYPLADCALPPVEMWLAICGGAPSGLSLSGVGRLVASLFNECNPMCMQAVAPWSRECREREGMSTSELTSVIAGVIVDKVTATLSTGPQLRAFTTSLTFCAGYSYSLQFDAQQAARGATAQCVGGLLDACETAFQVHIIIRRHQSELNRA